MFRKAVQKHFEGIVKRYGPGIVIPKNHLAAAHLPDQYEGDDVVLDTMPVERLHQVPKGFGSSIKNGDGFEKSVLVRCIAHQNELLRQAYERTLLLGQINLVFSIRYSSAPFI